MPKLFNIVPLLGVFFLSRLHAQTFDAATDFSSSSNTATSTWSYRYKPNLIRDGNYTLLTGFGPADGNWTPANPGAWTLNSTVPELGVNQTTADVLYSSGPVFSWPKGTMLVHPGVDQLVLVSWRSPATTLLNISFSFSDLDPGGGNGIRWFVEKNSATNTLQANTFEDGGASGLRTISSVAVTAGDRINFIVDPNGEYGFDSTKITATVTMVPEPSSLVSFGMAIMGFTANYRPRRRL